MAVDIYKEAGRVRYNLGDTEYPYTLDEMAIEFALSRYTAQTAEKRIWNASYDCFQFLLAKLANTTSTGRREKEGNVEIEEYGSSKYDQVKKAFDDFLKTSPEDISAFGYLVLGGVSQQEKNRVYDNSDGVGCPIKTGWTVSED